MRTMGAAHEGTRAGIAVLACVLVACGGTVSAQDASDTKQILERLDRLERQNAELIQEVRALRTQLGAKTTPGTETPPAQSNAALADTVAVQQARIDEQAQSKVEAAHKLPIRITGMALFNAFDFSHADAGLNTGIASLTPGRRQAGGTLSQSILGLEYWNNDGVLGAKIHGNLYMDFFGNANPYNPYSTASADGTYWWPTPRLRTGAIFVDWSSRSIMAGIDKPLIAPLNPDSLAQVALPPLSGAGNLWEWQPQVRFEQRLRLSDENKLTLQAALYATRETYGYAPGATSLEPTRPGWEGRVEFEHQAGEDIGFQIAPGFHFSTTHVAGQSVNSRILSVDGRFAMMHWWNLAGTIFTGQNVSGLGGVGPGFVVGEYGTARPVHASGGWLQLTLEPASRISFHLFGGEQENRRSDLSYDAVRSNAAFAANIYYRLAPNVFAAFEAGQVRTQWIYDGKRLRNQYDLSLAYLF